jgi:thiol-disulfide isomerase/thioredoxin
MVSPLLIAALVAVLAVVLELTYSRSLRYPIWSCLQRGAALTALVTSAIVVPITLQARASLAGNGRLAGALMDLGAAPTLRGGHWLNSKPLTLRALRGTVVLIHFWTYDCINCIHTLPYVTAWYDRYHRQGFTVIGVHTPEFAYEHVTANVQAAITQYHIHYPVLQDNSYATWNAYQNLYWPAFYLLDVHGHVRYSTVGEGGYDLIEQAIRTLLGAIHRRV